VFTITRPLLAFRYINDIRHFVELPSNKKGPNVVILSAHGRHKKINKKGKTVHSRVLNAIDDEIRISKEIRTLSHLLNKTVFILDACNVGQNSSSFREASNSLGVIGYSKSVDWIDSSTLILAILLKFQDDGIFKMRQVIPDRPRNIIRKMENGTYNSLFTRLGVDYSFR
jgi:hypothetical protein